MKNIRLGVLVVAALAFGTARAAPSQEVIHTYYSDAAMTQEIGSTDVTCFNHIIRQGVYPGSVGWNQRVQAGLPIYDYFDYGRCDNGFGGFACYFFDGSNNYGHPNPGEFICPF